MMPKEVLYQTFMKQLASRRLLQKATLSFRIVRKPNENCLLFDEQTLNWLTCKLKAISAPC